MNTRSDVYEIWCGMKQRCLNQNSRSYGRYGGRGITVCERWRGSFKNFEADMGPRPAGLTLDRINNDGNYEPGNCRWATVTTQNRNSAQAVPMSFGGETKTLAEWAVVLGVKYSTLKMRRLLGWPVDCILGGENMFRIGQEVSWSSQAAGITKEKRGTIVGVVPAGSRPDRAKFSTMYTGNGVGYSRNHESYVVKVRGVGHYWPRVARLRVVNPAEVAK